MNLSTIAATAQKGWQRTAESAEPFGGLRDACLTDAPPTSADCSFATFVITAVHAAVTTTQPLPRTLDRRPVILFGWQADRGAGPVEQQTKAGPTTDSPPTRATYGRKSLLWLSPSPSRW
jgi:hypothetical protein